MYNQTSSKNKANPSGLSRRDFIKTSAAVSVATAFAGANKIFAAGSDKVRIGLVGCGGRGTGAAIDCVKSSPNVEIVALGDLFKDRLDKSIAKLKKDVPDKLNLSPENCFVGFDAYKKVIATDVHAVLMATPPHFRPIHLKAAIEAGKHAFIEKPAATDPVGVRSVLETAELAKQKGLGIVAGTQSRYSNSHREIVRRIHNGDIGEVVGGQCYRLGDELWFKPRQPSWSDMEYQIRNWLYYIWLSGDQTVEMHIHQLDIVNWAMQSPPEEVVAIGGREVRTDPKFGNVYDHYAGELKYPNGARIAYMGRQIDRCGYTIFERFAGTKGNAKFDGGNSAITGPNAYKFDGERGSSRLAEHAALIAGIRGESPIPTDGKPMAESTLTAIMIRMSAFTGRKLGWNWAMNASKLDLSPPKYEFGDLEVRPVAIPGVTPLV